MKFKKGDLVTVFLDSSDAPYVIVEVRKGLVSPIYTISRPGSYAYDEVWEEELFPVEDPNSILKEIL